MREKPVIREREFYWERCKDSWFFETGKRQEMRYEKEKTNTCTKFTKFERQMQINPSKNNNDQAFRPSSTWASQHQITMNHLKLHRFMCAS